MPAPASSTPTSAPPHAPDPASWDQTVLSMARRPTTLTTAGPADQGRKGNLCGSAQVPHAGQVHRDSALTNTATRAVGERRITSSSLIGYTVLIEHHRCTSKCSLCSIAYRGRTTFRATNRATLEIDICRGAAPTLDSAELGSSAAEPPRTVNRRILGAWAEPSEISGRRQRAHCLGGWGWPRSPTGSTPPAI
jgi:hypothetical protein